MSDLIAFHPNDDGTQRIINILMSGGFVINETVVQRLPSMVNALRLYRDIDAKAAQEGSDDA